MWIDAIDTVGSHSPGLNAHKSQTPYDKHHKVSSLIKSHQTHTQFFQIWIWKCQIPLPNMKYLHSILNISEQERAFLNTFLTATKWGEGLIETLQYTDSPKGLWYHCIPVKEHNRTKLPFISFMALSASYNHENMTRYQITMLQIPFLCCGTKI